VCIEVEYVEFVQHGRVLCSRGSDCGNLEVCHPHCVVSNRDTNMCAYVKTQLSYLLSI
jgi:hypothetical protein